MSEDDNVETELLKGFLVQETFDNDPCLEVVEYETDKVSQARQLDRSGRRIDVLVLVKTTPQPSEKYVDTVCVAGLALNPLRWVRLYPIPFRYLQAENKFQKYSIISVEVSQSAHDNRIESLTVRADTIRAEPMITSDHGWEKRAKLVEPIGTVALCDLIEEVKANINAPSLAMVRPEPGSFSLKISEHPGWSESQQKKIEKHASRGEQVLIGEADTRATLEAPLLKIWAKFRCQDNCTGHELQFIDWEPTPLMRREAKQNSDLESVVRKRFEYNPARDDRDLRIFVGNQSDPQRRRGFQALGLYYPTRVSAEAARQSAPLF
ncbi:MAG: hypothetical protein WAS54_02465 [Scrofimicrobium sp.]